MKNNLFIIIGLLVFISACDVNKPTTDELYIKQIYLVNAQNVVYKRDVKYSSEPQQTSFSVATGGSTLIDRDVLVAFDLDNQQAIENYNWKYIPIGNPTYRSLESAMYTFPESTVIEANNVYKEVFFTLFATDGLQCDSLYSIPISIKSVSEYEINKTSPVLLFTLNLVNNYDGNYIVNGTDTDVWNNVEAYSNTRVVKATGEFSVRVLHKNVEENLSNVKAYAVVLTVDPLSNKIKVSAWDSFPIVDGGGVYDPLNKTFNAWYIYMDGASERKIEFKLTK